MELSPSITFIIQGGVSYMKEKTNKESVKKPIFKRWWFWAISVVVVIIAIASMGGKDNPAPKPTERSNTIS